MRPAVPKALTVIYTKTNKQQQPQKRKRTAQLLHQDNSQQSVRNPPQSTPSIYTLYILPTHHLPPLPPPYIAQPNYHTRTPAQPLPSSHPPSKRKQTTHIIHSATCIPTTCSEKRKWDEAVAVIRIYIPKDLCAEKGTSWIYLRCLLNECFDDAFFSTRTIVGWTLARMMSMHVQLLLERSLEANLTFID